MKKIIIAVVILLSAGIITSCNQQVNVKTTASVETNTAPFKKDIGTAD